MLALRASKALRGFVEQDSNPELPTIKKNQKGPLMGPCCFFWLGERDLNPR